MEKNKKIVLVGLCVFALAGCGINTGGKEMSNTSGGKQMENTVT